MIDRKTARRSARFRRLLAAGIGAGICVAGGLMAPNAHADNAPRLALPVSCDFGRDCFVQQYTDVDAAPSTFRDYACGRSSYDGHKGIDIRVVSLKRIVKAFRVKAAAGGRVKGVRDGMADHLMLTPDDRARVRDRECGNGVVIDHGDGWETQYCHLKRGSVQVRRGARVRQGDVLGLVGASGAAAFAHVHFGVRHNGAPVSPFLARPAADGCVRGDTVRGPGLWTADAYETLKWRGAQIIQAGFSAGPVNTVQAERGDIQPMERTSSALVFFARATNTRPGDKLRLVLAGPSAISAQSVSKPLPKRQAQYVSFVGKRLRAPRWPAGEYRGTAEILRDGRVIRTEKARLVLQ